MKFWKISTLPSSLASLIYKISSSKVFLVSKDIYESMENIDDLSLSLVSCARLEMKSAKNI